MAKSFRYIKHSWHVRKVRIAERGITYKQIREAMRNPDVVLSTKRGERHYKQFGKKTLGVVWNPDKEKRETAFVITVYWLDPDYPNASIDARK